MPAQPFSLSPRIAIVMDSASFGGYQINFYNLARWFAQAGHTVLCFFPEGSRLHRSAAAAGLKVIPFSKRTRFDFAAANRLARHLRERSIGHLYLGHPSDVWLARWCKRKVKGLKVYFNHELEYGLSKKDLWHAFLYKALDYWITPSRFLYDNTLQRVGIDPAKVVEITSGIEVGRFAAPEPGKADCRDRLGLPQNEFVVGIIGRIDPGKGQHHLVKALAILARQGLRPHAAIVGYDPRNEHEDYYREITALARQAGVSAQVHFIPFQNDVHIAYRALDAFVMASSREAYGFVTLEAMAAGLIVLGTDSGGTRDLIEDRVDGLLWQPENAEALAARLALVLKDDALAARMGLAAAAKMRQSFRHEAQIQTLIQLFSREH